MTPIKPPAPDQPLTSEELQKDADAAGMPSDEVVRGGGDTHLPASDSGEIED